MLKALSNKINDHTSSSPLPDTSVTDFSQGLRDPARLFRWSQLGSNMGRLGLPGQVTAMAFDPVGSWFAIGRSPDHHFRWEGEKKASQPRIEQHAVTGRTGTQQGPREGRSYARLVDGCERDCPRLMTCSLSTSHHITSHQITSRLKRESYRIDQELKSRALFDFVGTVAPQSDDQRLLTGATFFAPSLHIFDIFALISSQVHQRGPSISSDRPQSILSFLVIIDTPIHRGLGIFRSSFSASIHRSLG